MNEGDQKYAEYQYSTNVINIFDLHDAVSSRDFLTRKEIQNFHEY